MTEEASERSIEDHNWERRGHIMARARLSSLYHQKRARFLDVLDKVLLSFTVVLATSSAVSLLQTFDNHALSAWLGVMTAAASILPVVFAPAHAARRHADMARDFKRLLADCERAGEYWETEDCNRFMAQLVLIEVEESAPLGALLADCHNHVAMASGDYSNLITLNRWHRLLMHFWSFDVRKLKAGSASPA